MTKKLKRIAPLKFGIVVGILYGLISLIFVPFFLLIMGLAALAPNHGGTQQAIAQGVSLVMGLIFAIILPIFYAVFGALFGMLSAWLYNVVASWTGGIEFEVE